MHTLLENEDYYLGIFLLGAYQDTLGDFHNLLGCAHEGLAAAVEFISSASSE